MYSGTAITNQNGKQLPNYEKHERTSAQLIGLVGGTLSGYELDNRHQNKYATYQEMLSDPTIAFARMLCVAPLVTVGWSYEEKEGAPDGAKECIQESLEPWRMDILKAAMEGYIDYGWTPFEMVYSVEDNKAYLCKAKRLLQNETLILVSVTTGEYLGLRQFDWRGQNVDLGIYDSLHIAIDVEGTNWYGRALLENARTMWDQWNQVNVAANKYDTKVAGASWVVYYPVGSSPYNGVEDVDNFIIATDFLNKLQANGRLAVPMTIAKWQTDMNVTDENAGWKIELISDKGAGSVGFVERQKYLDALKVRAFGLPERAVLEGQFGTKAESEAQADFAITVFEMRHQIIVQQINRQVTNFLLATNFGEEFEDTVMIKANPLVDEKRMLLEKIYMQIITSPDGLMQELQSLDMETFRKQLDLPENPLLAQNGMPAAQGMLSEYFAELYGLQPPQATANPNIQKVVGQAVVPLEYWQRQELGLKLAFDESKHPRGQPDNKGRFREKGGAETTAQESQAVGETRSNVTTPEGSALSREDAKIKLRLLQHEWGRLGNKLQKYGDDVNNPAVRDLVEQQKNVTQQIYKLDTDPGNTREGIGQPGGTRDIVIIGSGPGGMVAGYMGGSNNLDTLVLEGGPTTGGQSKTSSRIENFPGFSAGIPGEHLAISLNEQVQRMKAEIQTNMRVTNLEYDDRTGLKTITTADGKQITARAVIIAGGVKLKTADWEGANSENVVYGDGLEVADKAENGTAVVVGGSNGGGQAALGAADKAKHVYLISRSPLPKGMSGYVIDRVHSNDQVTVIIGEIDRYDEENGFVYLKGDPELKIPADSIGMFIGGIPDTDWVPKSIKRNDKGQLKVKDASLETDMPGVYAVGDIRDGSLPRLVAAAGDGAVAEASAHAYFNKLIKLEDPNTPKQQRLF